MTSPNKDNPYQSPQDSDPALVKPISPDYDGQACPFCGARDAKSPSFTFWGGAIGHKILSHVKCQQCKKGFNSKTGKSNLTNIIIYQVVVFCIAIGVVLAIQLSF